MQAKRVATWVAMAAASWALALPAARAQQDDEAALELADQAPQQPQQAQPAGGHRIYFEAAAARQRLLGGTRDDVLRASADLRFDWTLGPGLRAVLSDRLDLIRHDERPRERNVNALREAYLSWQARPDLDLELGRVNIRHGLGWGYNPTDFFRAGSLRSIVSPDPADLRENRLGTVAAQAHKVWADSALSLAYSPRLERRPSDDTWSLDLGSTNAEHRWLLTASHRFGPAFNPQLLLHGGEDTDPQVGLNLSALVSDAAVAYAELAVGKDRPLLARALDLDAPEEWQQRAAVGFTYTTTFDLSVTLEADYNSAAPRRGEWDALLAGTPTDALRVLQTALDRQDLPVRRGLFLYATWRDAVVRRLDLSGFVRHDAETHSRQQWLEARYRFDRMDVALQWQLNSGGRDTVFGSVPERRAVELSLRFYL